MNFKEILIVVVHAVYDRIEKAGIRRVLLSRPRWLYNTSVVTKDIPDNVIAVGNPCKVPKEITEAEINKEYKREE